MHSVQSPSAIPSPGRGTDEEVTQLIHRWQAGDVDALDRLLPKVYADLRAMARHQLEGERADTLQPTALVHDVLLRLIGGDALRINDRSHFFKTVARAMRHLLIDRARRAKTDKHGGGAAHLELHEAIELAGSTDTDLERLDAALGDLETIEPDLARIVDLRYFVGLKVREVTKVLGVDESTVYRDWALARVWLREQLES